MSEVVNEITAAIPGGSSRPLVVSLLALVYGVVGFLLCVAGSRVLNNPMAAVVVDVSAALNVASSSLGYAIALAGLVLLALAYGFWKLTNWAWYLQVGISVLLLYFALTNFSIIKLAIQALILYYFWSRRSAFGVNISV